MSKHRIELDYALAMDAGSRCGLSDAQLQAEKPAFERGLKRVKEEAKAGVLGFWGLPKASAVVDEIEAFVNGLQGIEDVLVLGIGGSSLGGRAVYEALAAPKPARRLHFPDNSDPHALARLLDALSPKSTMALAISKSGGTVEMAAQLLIVRKWLGEHKKNNLVLITDPERGTLRAMAKQEGLKSFSIPSNVGGRFSVLTPVGLLPAALAGIDVRSLLDGAREMAERCGRSTLEENPAGIFATVHVLHQRLHGRPIHVLMPYADALRATSAWFVQLWAESLGKRIDRQGRVIEVGPTPIPSVGATDQHAQVQLFMEGPRDKLVTFVAVGEVAKDLEIPKEDGEYAYLGGHRLSTLLDAERRGTALALAGDRRPSLTISLPQLHGHTLGGLFFLLEAATAIAGELYGIDAFDQPGVERGKRLAFGLLGRSGYEAEAQEVKEAESRLPTQYRIRD